MTNEDMERLAVQEHQRRDEEAIGFVMSDPRGRWFVSRLLERCHCSMSNAAYTDINKLVLHEGERRIGVDMLNNIEQLENGLSLRHAMEDERAAFYRWLASVVNVKENEHG